MTIHFHIWNSPLGEVSLDVLVIGLYKTNTGNNLGFFFDSQVITDNLKGVVLEEMLDSQVFSPTLLSDSKSGNQYLAFNIGQADFDKQKSQWGPFFKRYSLTMNALDKQKIGFYISSFGSYVNESCSLEFVSAFIDYLVKVGHREQGGQGDHGEIVEISKKMHYYFVIPNKEYGDYLKFMVQKQRAGKQSAVEMFKIHH